jgi:hypothetical protein
MASRVYIAAAAASAHTTHPSGFSLWGVVVAVAVFVGVIAATAVATVVLEAPIQAVAARVLGGLGPIHGPNLGGYWYSGYSFVSSRTRQRVHTTQLMLFRQFGPYVVGKCIWSDGAHRHFITGRTHGHVFTGQWRNVADGAKHHGVLQMLIDPDGTHLHGKWLGYDARNHIQQADWTFTLASRDVKANRDALIQARLPVANPEGHEQQVKDTAPVGSGSLGSKRSRNTE